MKLLALSAILLVQSFGIVMAAATNGYTYYKWSVTGIKDSSSASYVQAAEFEFSVNGQPYDWLALTIGSPTNPNGDSPSGEEVLGLVDGDFSTKWLDRNFAGDQESTVIFNFTVPQVFTGYRWATANDRPERDPRDWTISGSQDGAVWEVLDTVNAFDATLDRDTWQRPGAAIYWPLSISGTAVSDPHLVGANGTYACT
jgi:hypothetical protein